MFETKYILSLDPKKKCTNVKSLSHLIQSNSSIKIENETIIYENKSFPLQIKSQTGENKSNIHFQLNFTCTNENNLETFSQLLREINTSLSLIGQNYFIIRNDLNLYYAEKAYPILFKIENLMRQLITTFMLINVGVDWTKETIPSELENPKNSTNDDTNYLNNIDFIKLSDLLFSKNYPQHKESLVKKLQEATDIESLDIKDIQSLIPSSNRDKYFKDIIGCHGDDLKKKRKQLYDLRCKVAHNKKFTKKDLDDVKNISLTVERYIKQAIITLDNITISDAEKNNITDEMTIKISKSYEIFIDTFNKLQSVIYSAAHIITSDKEIDIKKLNGLRVPTTILMDNGIIDLDEYNRIKDLFIFRNSLIRRNPSQITNIDQHIISAELLISCISYRIDQQNSS